jgi:site-specific DNA-methyltransferase (adenine-specific)
MFSKASDSWRTPEDLFCALDAEFGFDVDVAATADNCWKENYLGPDRGRADREDALSVNWVLAGPVCFMNPPYSRCRDFIAKAAQEARNGATVVCLVPSRTDTRFWHQHVWDAEKHQPRPGVEIRFLKGRLKFGNSANSAPFPSVIVIFRPPEASA